MLLTSGLGSAASPKARRRFGAALSSSATLSAVSGLALIALRDLRCPSVIAVARASISAGPSLTVRSVPRTRPRLRLRNPLHRRDGDEVLQNYRLSPHVPRPEWYASVDPEEEARRWARLRFARLLQI